MTATAAIKTDEIQHPISDAFREAMRQLAAGVSIIAAGTKTECTGITVTSLTPLSMEPPTILTCVNRTSSLVPFLHRYWRFSVNLLSAQQQEIAERFTGRNGHQGFDRFQSEHWGELPSGTPVLLNALATIDCELEEIIERHSHMIVLGRVVDATVKAGAAPLLYHQRMFSSSR